MDPLAVWNQLAPEVRSTIVRVVLAVVVLALVWALRSALSRLLVAPLRRIAQRRGLPWGDVLLDTLMLPMRLLVIALGLALGAQILQVDASTAQFVERLIRTLLILALFAGLYRSLDVLAPSSSQLSRVTGLSIPERLLPFVRTAGKIIFIALAFIVMLQEWGFDASGLIAGLGLGGLALSLAAKDTAENLFGFTTIVGDQPFVVGEFIKTPEVEGTVEHVGVRSTRIRQPNQAYVTVPNSKLAAAVVLNWSRLSKRWIDMILRIEYGPTAGQVQTLLERIRALLAGRELVEKDSIVVYFITFGDSGLEILVRAYVLLVDWVAFTAETEAINLEIMKIIEEMGLSIAIPNRSVYIEHEPHTQTRAAPTLPRPTEENPNP